MSSIEMDDLSANKNKAAGSSEDEDVPDNEKDEAISTWTMMAASLLIILAAIFSLFPQLLLFLSAETPSTLTPLERFLSIHFGIWLFTIAVALVLNIPSSSPLPLGLSQPDHPLLKPFTFACLISSLISYNTRSVGTLASVHCLLTAVVGLWGLWVIVFGSSVRVSKKTGADKHTSSFIFGNKSAASKQKKEWLRQQKGGRSS
ncbi:hypothetical protein J3R30DRAFT_3432066 [Lentinula aciculospora]|uniref:Transmembrane protein n=1 Tax=Lentinula aciculospora TaxID=153920 RepID=A0A9W9DWT8_9AGAR|nr:hypothetical protein J3R30DRAFT_3432066 [Lentinula aciculospora]